MKILITGATGLVGRSLGKLLADKGHEVFAVSRNAASARSAFDFPCQIIEGNLTQEGLRQPIMNEMEAVIHLAGEPITGSWTEKKKSLIYDSRVKSSQNLISSLADNKKLKVVISASGTGYYGSRGDEILDEKSLPGSDFLAHVCKDWERPWEKAKIKNELNQARVIILRFGLVLAANGGFLQKIQGPFRWGVGAALGNGRHWMSWIHIQDLLQIIVWSLENSQSQGVYNAVTVDAKLNKDFSKALAQQFHRPMLLAVPGLALKLALGEQAEMVLASQRVEPHRLNQQGFQFRFPTLAEALQDIYSKA